MYIGWSRPRWLLLLAIFAASSAAQENRDGLLPAVAPDRNLSADIGRALAAGDFAQAQKEIEELARRAPRSYEPEFWAGYLHFRQADYYEAIRALRRAEALDPNPFVLKLLAVSYYAAHQRKLFLIKIRAAQERQPSDFAPYYYLGRYYDSDVTDFERAAEYFRQSLGRQPDHFRSHYYLGHCYEMQEVREQAEAEYRKAAELAERQGANEGLPYQGLARLRLFANRPAEALAFARLAVKFGPRDPAAHKLLARAYSDLGRHQDASAEWKRSSVLDATDASTLYRLYRSYQSLGHVQEARAALAEYQKIARLYGTN